MCLCVYLSVCVHSFCLIIAACEILHTSFPIGMNLHFHQLISISFRLFSLSKRCGGRTDLDLDDHDYDDGSHLFNMRRHYPLLWRFCISVPYDLARQPRGRATSAGEGCGPD